MRDNDVAKEYADSAQCTQPITLLYLDDDSIDRTLMGIVLGGDSHEGGYDYREVGSIEDARVALASGEIDIFVTDNRMPFTQGYRDTLAQVGPINKRTKIVVVSSEVDSAYFRDVAEIGRKPDAVVDKLKLRKIVKAGLFRDLFFDRYE